MKHIGNILELNRREARQFHAARCEYIAQVNAGRAMDELASKRQYIDGLQAGVAVTAGLTLALEEHLFHRRLETFLPVASVILYNEIENSVPGIQRSNENNEQL